MRAWAGSDMTTSEEAWTSGGGCLSPSARGTVDLRLEDTLEDLVTDGCNGQVKELATDSLYRDLEETAEPPTEPVSVEEE